MQIIENNTHIPAIFYTKWWWINGYIKIFTMDIT